MNKTSLPRSGWRMVCAAALLATPFPAPAQTGPSLSASGGCFFGSFELTGNTASQIFGVGCDVADTSSAGGWQDPRGSGSAASWSASASPGSIAGFASASASNLPSVAGGTPPGLLVTARTGASFEDQVTFDVPGVAAGSRGRAVFSVLVSGSASASTSSPTRSSAEATWQVSIQLTTLQGRPVGSASAGGSRSVGNGQPASGATDVLVPTQLVLPVEFGVPLQLFVGFYTTATGVARPEGAFGSPEYAIPVNSVAEARFGNTAEWNGISSVRLQNGTTVSNWSITSASGINYAVPISEPPAGVLALVGLPLLGWLVRARQRRAGGLSAA